MAEVGSLYVKIGAKTDEFERKLAGARDKMRDFGIKASAVGGALTLAVSRPLLQLGKAAISSAADMEQTRVAFETMIGSADRAGAVLEDLRKFAASTPFEFPELADASRKLIAFGVSAEDTVDTLRRLGDVSAGIGAPIGEIAELYGKARVQGRLFAEDVNQFTGRGIPIIGELAKQFGVAESGVRKLVEQGKVGFSNLEQAFVALTSSGGKFAGMMDKQSQTLAGRMSTLRDNVGELGRSIAEQFLPAVTKIAEKLSELAQRFNDLDEPTKKMVGYMAALVISLPLVITAVGALSLAMSGLTVKTALATGGITLLLGGLALLALNWEEVTKNLEKWWSQFVAALLEKTRIAVEALDIVWRATNPQTGASPFASVLGQLVKLRDEAMHTVNVLTKVYRGATLPDVTVTARKNAATTTAGTSGTGADPPAQLAAGTSKIIADIKAIQGELSKADFERPFKLASFATGELNMKLRETGEVAEGAFEKATEGASKTSSFVAFLSRTITDNLSVGIESFSQGVEKGFEKMFTAALKGRAGVLSFANAWKVLAASALSAVADVIRAIRNQMVAMLSAQAAAYAIAGAWRKAAKAAAAALAVGASLSIIAAGTESLAQKKMEAVPMAEGGIVRRPTLAMVGERGPEAVVPLNRMSAPTQPVLRVGIGELWVEMDRYGREHGLSMGRS